jgi:hypothetical protein
MERYTQRYRQGEVDREIQTGIDRERHRQGVIDRETQTGIDRQGDTGRER